MTGTIQVAPSTTISQDHQTALDKIFAAERTRRDAEAATTAKALENWRTRYRAERTRVLGTGLQAQLDTYTAKNTTAGALDSDGVITPIRIEEVRQRRLDSFRFAHNLGVNWAGLAALHKTASRELRDLLTPRRTPPTLGDVQLFESSDTEPQPMPTPDQGSIALQRAPDGTRARGYGLWSALRLVGPLCRKPPLRRRQDREEQLIPVARSIAHGGAGLGAEL